MEATDGSKGSFLIGQLADKNSHAPTVNLLLGAIGAAVQLAAQEAASAVPEREVAIYEALTAAVPTIVDTAMDMAFVVSAIGSTIPRDYETLLRDTENPLAGAVLRSGQRFIEKGT